MELEIRNLSKKYGTTRAVDNLNLCMKQGVYGLLGANGSGKTTLMRMICGVLKPTDGEVCYGQKKIQDLGEKYRDVLGYLPQDFGYYPDFTAKDFMLYIASLKGLKNREAKEKTEELLKMTALDDVKKKKIKTFSGGMKQRLGIAQALLNNPEILVLDEPTAGLDPKERVRFRNMIAELGKDRIVILSTHIVSDVEYIADKIFVMKKGNLLLEGSAEELIEKIRGKVWKCQVTQREAEELQEKCCVANLHHTGEGAELTIVSDEKPHEMAEVVEQPTLEELYLYYFQDVEAS